MLFLTCLGCSTRWSRFQCSEVFERSSEKLTPASPSSSISPTLLPCWCGSHTGTLWQAQSPCCTWSGLMQQASVWLSVNKSELQHSTGRAHISFRDALHTHCLYHTSHTTHTALPLNLFYSRLPSRSLCRSRCLIDSISGLLWICRLYTEHTPLLSNHSFIQLFWWVCMCVHWGDTNEYVCECVCGLLSFFFFGGGVSLRTTVILYRCTLHNQYVSHQFHIVWNTERYLRGCQNFFLKWRRRKQWKVPFSVQCDGACAESCQSNDTTAMS